MGRGAGSRAGEPWLSQGSRNPTRGRPSCIWGSSALSASAAGQGEAKGRGGDCGGPEGQRRCSDSGGQRRLRPVSEEASTSRWVRAVSLTNARCLNGWGRPHPSSRLQRPAGLRFESFAPQTWSCTSSRETSSPLPRPAGAPNSLPSPASAHLPQRYACPF